MTACATRTRTASRTHELRSHFTARLDGDGIALVTWNSPGRSMNVIDAAVIEELVGDRRAGRGRCRDQGRGHHLGQGYVLRRRRSHHAGNAEPRLRGACGVAGRGRRRMRAVSKKAARSRCLYRRIETCGKPWVAAINGTAVGGGFELTLACHHRVAADNDKTRLGLPEIKVGLFPGAGGTQRVARMLPPADALQFLLKGDQISRQSRQGDEARRRRGAGRRSDRSRQGLDHGRAAPPRRRGTSRTSSCPAARCSRRPA